MERVTRIIKLFNFSDLLLILMAWLVMFLLTSCAGSKNYQRGDYVRVKDTGVHGYIWEKSILGYLVLVRDNSSLDAADRTLFDHTRPRNVSLLRPAPEGKLVVKGGRK